jgi:hypothetical protein
LAEEGEKSQMVGLRFTGVEVPRGAVIRSAWVQFTVDEPSDGGIALEVRGIDEGDARPFGSYRGVSLRLWTAASTAWSPPEWPHVGASGAGQRTADLAAVIQEIIGRADWTPGNALALVVVGSGTRTAESYDGSPTEAPLLHIEYAVGPPDSGPNIAPVVSAAADPVTAGGTALLDGTVSDDGLPVPPGTVAVTWRQTGGPVDVVIADPDREDATVVLPAPGEYTFSLTASDGELSSVASVAVTATDGPLPIEMVEIRVRASGDDVEELSNGWLYRRSTDLELVNDEKERQTVGLRFEEVAVPQGAAVTAAWVQFTVDERSEDSSSLLVRGIDEGDAGPFGWFRGVSGRPLTAVSAEWAPPEWPTVGAAGEEQRTGDLSGVVQAVVDRPDWVQGNTLGLVITGSGTRTAESYDGSPTEAPLLHIEYRMP